MCLLQGLRLQSDSVSHAVYARRQGVCFHSITGSGVSDGLWAILLKLKGLAVK